MNYFFRSSVRLIQSSSRKLHNLAETTESLQNFTNRKSHKLNFIVNSDLELNEKLKNNEKIDDNQWIQARESLIKNFRANEASVDSQIFDICTHFKRRDEAANYFQFLERNNYKLNLNTIGDYFKSFSHHYEPLTSQEEEKICRMYDELRKKYPLLDGMTCSSCIYALSLTKRWKECLELLEMIKIASAPGTSVIKSLIYAAFKNGEPLLGWKMIEEGILKGPLDHYVYVNYINFCQENYKDTKLKDEIEKMFNFWRKHQVLLPENIIKNYVETYQQCGYKATFTSILKKGLCLNCQHKLNKTAITKEEFNNMSKSILKNIIVGENIYQSTSPQELKRYLLFIQTMKPYDVVIDGLNVAYGGRRTGEKGSLMNILNVINYFEKANKRILVIGRAHMNWWSKELMSTIQKKSDVFLTKNLSQDDPFLLHITLLSGPDTYFVSRDLMRQHKFKLDENLKNLFKQWQLSRQYLFHRNQQTQRITLQSPSPFETFAQQDSNGWHVPYVIGNKLRLEDSYSAPKNWVCIRKKQSK